ncbi:MAG TPA: diacylglycerol kinase family protein [Vicinamibacterales bacterium]
MTALRAKLIANPVAGEDEASAHLETINRALREDGGTLDIALTAGEGDAIGLAADAARQGYERLYVAGGDGTLNEVLNGVLRVPGAFARIAFGIIPLGTGNDFASTLGMSEDIEETIALLRSGETIDVDLGYLDDRCFVNVSAGGFIAEVSDAVDPALKTVAGKLAYVLGGAKVLWTHDPIDVRVQGVEGFQPIEADDVPDSAAAVPEGCALHAFAVCNAPLVGGGRLIAPHASITDGHLDVCLIEAMSRVEFVGLLARVSSGEHVEDGRVRYFRARQLELAFDRPVKVNTDGQVLERSVCRYRVAPGAARFLCSPARREELSGAGA